MGYTIRLKDKRKRQPRKAQKEAEPPILPSGRHYGAFRHAIKIAQGSDCNYRHGATLMMGGSILSFGCNRLRYDARYMDGPVSLHAEAAAIMKSKVPYYANMKNLVVYVVRVDDLGQLRMSKPCENCLEFMRQHNVKRVHFSTDDGFEYINI